MFRLAFSNLSVHQQRAHLSKLFFYIQLDDKRKFFRAHGVPSLQMTRIEHLNNIVDTLTPHISSVPFAWHVLIAGDSDAAPTYLAIAEKTGLTIKRRKKTKKVKERPFVMPASIEHPPKRRCVAIPPPPPFCPEDYLNDNPDLRITFPFV